jgi:UDP-3-O-[3-hydroxymyristoyl] glucosamine N-acyltransferase
VGIVLRRIADSIGGRVEGDDSVVINGISPLGSAKEGEITFMADQRLLDQLRVTRASAVIVKSLTELFAGPQVIVPDPYLAYARVAAIFAPPPPRFDGVSERAVIGEGVSLGKGVSVYPFVYVGKGAVIGDEVILFPGVYIGDGVRIGEGTVIYPNVSVLPYCVIGRNVIIHAGSVIGSDGFGYARDSDVSVKIPQTGIVEIGDEVEIGANTAIDRASFEKTVIETGVKTDNLVQIGHNVVVGEHTIIVAQAGIAGSTRIGKNVIIGPQTGVKDHLEIGDRAMVVGGSGVMRSIPAGAVVSGFPTMPHRLWLKTREHIRRLPDYVERLKGLEKRIGELEQQGKKMPV